MGDGAASPSSEAWQVRGPLSWRRVDGGTGRVEIWRLRDVVGNQAHLVVGQDSSLLVDTLGGFGNISEAVKELCDLPVRVVLTHGHNDHVGGAYFYPEAYLAACEASDERLAEEEALAATAHASLVRRGIIDESEPWGVRDGARPALRDLRDGDRFDLGGVTVETVGLAAHTAGSMGFLVREARVLLTGDAVTPTMCLFFNNSGTVDDWRGTLAHMVGLPFDVFYTSHQDRSFRREELADFDACGAFVESDRGTEWVHDLFPQFTGRIHIYRGADPEADDFLALIERETDETRERARRLRAEARARRRRSGRSGTKVSA